MSVGKKLFVGNLPFSTSDQELERVFSEYGGLKAAFTVKEKGEVECQSDSRPAVRLSVRVSHSES